MSAAEPSNYVCRHRILMNAHHKRWSIIRQRLPPMLLSAGLCVSIRERRGGWMGVCGCIRDRLADTGTEIAPTPSRPRKNLFTSYSSPACTYSGWPRDICFSSAERKNYANLAANRSTKNTRTHHGYEIANVNFYAVRPESYQIRWNNAK